MKYNLFDVFVHFYINQARLNPPAGLFWSTGHVFDAPALEIFFNPAIHWFQYSDLKKI